MSDQYITIHQDSDPFSRVPKSLLSDTRLSWKAKGVLAYLIGKTPDWKVRITDVVNQSTDGRDSVRSAIDELKQAGYAKSECVKSETGQVDEWKLHVSDRPIFANVSPETGFPDLAEPEVEKPTLSKNEVLPRMIIEDIRGVKFQKPELAEVIAYGKEIGLPESECARAVNRWESVGWMVGKNKMKSWKAALRTWKGNWEKWNPKAPEPIKDNSIRIRIGRIFARPDSEPWNEMEERQLSLINPSSEQVSSIERLYRNRSYDPKYRYKSVASLLNNWSQALDQARTTRENKGF